MPSPTSDSDPTSLPRLRGGFRVDPDVADPPPEGCEALSEKVLQFGTGAFLRGFVDAFVDRAIRDGAYDGRVVMVGSTGSGRAAQVNRQNGLYTLCVQGLEDGRTIDRCTVIGAVSRAIASQDQWDDVLECARDPQIGLVVSNTTEVGIRYDPEDRIDLDPPRSYPGKLTALLYERARIFDYEAVRGWRVLCCELVEGNGDRLREIVLRLGEEWALGARFLEWTRSHVRFCNTLVDRIVPGTPDEGSRDELFGRLGYSDELLVQVEPYRLWAIEGSASLREELPFTDPGIVVAEDIHPFRERKVRLLNGTHTVMVPVSLLCGNRTVRETMEHPRTSAFVRRVMLEEIVPTLELDADETRRFAEQVLDRFSNPFIGHELIDITFQQTTKMRVRVLPSLRAYVAARGELPEAVTFGFAAYLHFVRTEREGAPHDEQAEAVRRRWREVPRDGGLRGFVADVCSDEALWGASLEALPDFGDRVAHYLKYMAREGVDAALGSMLQTAPSKPEAKP